MAIQCIERVAIQRVSIVWSLKAGVVVQVY
jgi:hypothetical protein